MLQGYDALGLRTRAEALVKQTADELKAIVQEMARRVDFPLFPGTPFRCIEAEPGRSQGNQFGCIVICPDGELRELTVEVQSPGADLGITRREDLVDIVIAPPDYIVYVHNAIQDMSRLLAAERIY